MKKAVAWLAVILLTIFVVSWGVGGIMLFNGDFDNFAWVYIGFASIMIFFNCLIYLKITRCPHCGRINRTRGKFCPHCGQSVR